MFRPKLGPKLFGVNPAQPKPAKLTTLILW